MAWSVRIAARRARALALSPLAGRSVGHCAAGACGMAPLREGTLVEVDVVDKGRVWYC